MKSFIMKISKGYGISDKDKVSFIVYTIYGFVFYYKKKWKFYKVKKRQMVNIYKIKV